MEKTENSPHEPPIRPAATVLGMGAASAAQPMVGTAYRHGSGHVEHAHRAVTAHGIVGLGSPTDMVYRGRWCENRWGSGSTPNKVAVVGAHPSTRVDDKGKERRWLVDVPRRWHGGVVRWPGRAAMRSCNWRRRLGR
jgi:hypothetical protein